MTKATHIIHRVNLEFEVPDVKTGKLLQEDAMRIMKNDVLPVIEDYLEEVWKHRESVRIPQMDLTLKNIHLDQFEDEFAEWCIREFTTKMGQLLPKESIDRETEHIRHENLSPEEKQLEQFLFFIHHGYLPWWSVDDKDFPNEKHILANRLLSKKKYRDWLVYLLMKTPHALDRLIYQFSRSFTVQLIHLSYTGNRLRKADTPAFAEGSKRPGVNARRELFIHWMERLRAAHHSGAERTDAHYKPDEELVSDTQIQDLQKAPEDGFFVDHAGLILLHPFLEYFFRDCGLLAKKHFRDENARNTAIHLLYYLATGKKNPPEHELLFHKFLCGMDPELPIPRKIPIRQSMLDEADQLLQSAIGHWKILKRTSPQGLREGFLLRKGKLILDDFQHRLIIEGNTIDVLLSGLPWGYGVVKLPWLKQPLIVDWNH